MKKKKKLLAAAVSAVMSVSSMAAALPSGVSTVSGAEKYNYGEALQKSMFFYEVQQAGVLPDWNEVSWRADSMENDEVPGGWFDAGDHIKFALTNAYTSAVLAWGIYQYKDAVKKAGLYDLYLKNLKWGLDYVAGCDRGDKVVGTIADDAFDHVWWGSAEVYMRKFILKGGTDPRPYDEITCTSTMAQMAAAMASGYLVFKDEDPAAAEGYLKHAKSLFETADKTRDNTDQGVQGGGNYYKASDYFDDLFYAANWMYMATGDKSYLDKCEKEYIPQFPLENQSTDRKFTWGFCWDDASQGAALLYAINTGKQEWIDQVAAHLDYWTTGHNGKQVSYTPDGLAWLFQWGSLRHATTTAFLASVASDTLFKNDSTKADKYNTFAKRQMDYAFGDNAMKMSYVLGMGDKNPNSWHHRTSSGVWDDKWGGLGTEPAEEGGILTKEGSLCEYAHTLYGALEGGPNQDGTFTDQVNAYQNTEVAIDYNAGFTAELCALLDDYGGTPLADFPPVETPKWTEFFMKASINQAAGSYTEVKAFAMNHSAWPARTIKDLSYNYYFDISELKAAGLTADDITVKIGYDQHSGDEGKASISKPQPYKGSDSIYFVKISFDDGRVVMPTGQSEHRSECQFRISIPDNVQGVWDTSNDYSFKDLKQGGEDAMIETPYITMYDGDTLIWGEEPDGTKPEATTPTKPKPTDPTDPPVSSYLRGDINLSGGFNMADAVTLGKFLVKNYSPEKILFENGDMNSDSKLNVIDWNIMKRELF